MKHVIGKDSKTTLTQIKKEDIQPNAIDLRLDRVFKINDKQFEISNEHKKHRGSFEIKPDKNDYFELSSGAYEIVFENIINVGENETGFVITRSTFIRNGCFLISGLYDSGYVGAMTAALHITTAPAKIKKGTRIGQYLSFDAEMLYKYNGSYGFDGAGNPKEDEKKYHSI